MRLPLEFHLPPTILAPSPLKALAANVASQIRQTTLLTCIHRV